MAQAAGGTTSGDRAKGMSRRRGPRLSSEANARQQIVSAASKEFLAHGYDTVSIRAIARRAGVDAALVHHYFEDKAQLFAETVFSPIRPDQIVRGVLGGPRSAIGVNLVVAALTAMESGNSGERIIGLIRTALGHDFAATMLRQFLVREVIGRIAGELEVDDGDLRATLVASQIVGLFVVRYGIKADPLASTSIEEAARRIGPVIQWHLTGYPAGLDSATTPPE